MRSFLLELSCWNLEIFKFLNFHIRCFVLVTGSGKAYLYRAGYMRTACGKFVHGAFKDINIHLTNTAVQSKHSEFGRYHDER